MKPMTNTSYCVNCGQLIDPSLNYCQNCGLPLTAQPELRAIFTELPHVQRRRRQWWRPILRLVLVGCVIGGFGYGVWRLTYALLDTHLLTHQQGAGGDILSVVFNISTSILTLVGLVTIFVSINAQHRIQRCREILWELMELPYQCWNNRGHFEYNFSLEQGIRQRFLAYKEVLNSGRAFNYVIVLFSFAIITAVSSMITATILGLGTDYFQSPQETAFLLRVVVIGVVMMLAFGLLILSLARITLIASLPSLTNLIDAGAIRTGIPSVLFAAITMRVIPTNPLLVRFPFPFRNLEVYPWIVGTRRDTHEEVLILGDPFASDTQKFPLTRVHIDAERAHRMRFLVLEEFDVTEFERVVYKFELRSAQGTVYVDFEQVATERGMTQDWLHPVGMGPKLRMENRLFEGMVNQ